MTKKEKALIVIDALKKRYPDAKCSLVASAPHELLIATRLSAQCTDARVNIVTEELFNKYRSINDFADADIADIENIIHSCGLYKTKAMGDVYGQPAVVADTHLIRISGRLGFVDTKDPYKVELAMKKILPPEESNNYCHRMVQFGRDVCKAQNPDCKNCELYEVCKSKGKKK